MMSLEQCPISWCTVEQPHGPLHEQVLLTFHAHLLGSQQGRTIQTGLVGYDEFVAQPALTIIRPDGLGQESVELFWEDALRVGPQWEAAWARFRRP